MLEKTGTPSVGQPLRKDAGVTDVPGFHPPIGLQFGDEYLRRPTNPIACGFGPVTVLPSGRCRVKPTGIELAGMPYDTSAKKGPQPCSVPNPSVTAAGFRSERFCRSIQVCGLPKLISFVASRRCPCDPT